MRSEIVRPCINLFSYNRFLSNFILIKEDTPMHNSEEPNHFYACRLAGCEIARISCMAAGTR